MPDTPPIADGIRGITATVRQYLALLIEDTRLNVTEKLTRLLAAIALASLLTILITVALVFITLAVGFALASALSPLWGFIIVAAFYILIMVILICFRKPLLVNPIARFISVLLLDAPTTEPANDQSTTISNQ